MKKHAFLSPEHSTSGHRKRQMAYSLGGMLSIGLTGLLLLGGCNKTPAPAAPAAEPATTAQAAPPPAPAPAPDAAPAAAPAPAPAQSAAPPPPPPAPAVPPPPPPPKKYVVPAGSQLVVRVGQTITAKGSNVGDSFTGTLSQSLVVHGVKVIRAGAPVTGTVVAAKGQGRFKGAGDLVIAVNRVGNYSVATSSYEATAKGKGQAYRRLRGWGRRWRRVDRWTRRRRQGRIDRRPAGSRRRHCGRRVYRQQRHFHTRGERRHFQPFRAPHGGDGKSKSKSMSGNSRGGVKRIPNSLSLRFLLFRKWDCDAARSCRDLGALFELRGSVRCPRAPF